MTGCTPSSSPSQRVTAPASHALNGYQNLVNRRVIGQLEHGSYHYQLVRMELPAGKAGAGSIVDYSRFFFGISNQEGKELLAPRYDLILKMGEHGLVLCSFDNDEVVAKGIVPWNGFPPTGSPLIKLLDQVSTSSKRDWINVLGPRYDRPVPYAEAFVHWSKKGRHITRYNRQGQVTHTWHDAKLGQDSVGQRKTIKHSEGIAVLGSLWSPQSEYADSRWIQMGDDLNKNFKVLTVASPNHPKLRWFPQGDKFAPPPESDGVIPIDRWRSFGGGHVLGSTYIPDHTHIQYQKDWLVAYPAPSGHIWGTATADFSQISGPQFLEVRTMFSPAQATADWEPHWYLFQKIENGRWIVTRGDPKYPANTFKKDGGLTSDADFATAYEAFKAAEAPIIRKNQKIESALAYEARKNREEESRRYKFEKRQYASARKAGDVNMMRQYAHKVGGDALRDFIQSGYASTTEIRSSIQSTFSPFTEEERLTLAKAADMADIEFKRREDIERRQREANNLAIRRANNAAASRDEWATWNANRARSADAHYKAVKKQTYRNAMKAYKDGLRSTLPNY